MPHNPTHDRQAYRMKKLKILSVASEIYPLIKTGGLADVAGALPRALEAEGVEMHSLVPGYPKVMTALQSANPNEVCSFANLFGGSAKLLAGTVSGLKLFVLDAPHLYARPGNPYIGPDDADWPDNALRFAALAKTAAAIGQGLLSGFVPDIIHIHDWQAALTPAYLRYSGKPGPATVITVHNLAFQGQFPADMLATLELPPESLTFDGVEHYGAIGFLKAALQLADWITTVSPSYAAEIQRPETGMGLDGLLRARSGQLSGILNGIDIDVWNPATDPQIVKNYDLAHLEDRATNKIALQKSLGLAQEPRALVAGVISRLSWQKGLDLLLDVLPTLLEENIQLALLGAGDADLEIRYRAAAEAHPGRIGVRLGYDEALAHRIQGGADVFVIPSRYEPCGLTQLCALHYGAIPVVAHVGGLSDTIIDANEMAIAAGVATGVHLAAVTAEDLAVALRKTAALYREGNIWRTMQKNGMTTDVSWRGPARHYAALYRRLVK
jgi:starch synthase